VSTQLLIPTTSSASNPCPNTDAFSGIASLTLWLRADCVTGNAADPADNSTVSTWVDLSGNGNNATGHGTPTYQSDAANLINSQPVVNFNGSSSFTSIDIRAITRPNITIFSVYKLRGTNNVGIWGIDDGGWDRFFMARWTGDNGIISHSGTTTVPNSGVNTTTKLITTVYKYNENNGSSVYDNGSFVSSFTDNAAESAAQTTLRIGSIGAISGSTAQFTNLTASSIINNGGFVSKRTSVSTNTTLNSSQHIIGIDTATATGSLTLSLPNASTLSNGQVYIIKDEGGMADTKTITISCSVGSQTIDGSSTMIIESPYAAVNIYCNGLDKYFIY
jgi:hypothetical protein